MTNKYQCIVFITGICKCFRLFLHEETDTQFVIFYFLNVWIGLFLLLYTLLILPKILDSAALSSFEDCCEVCQFHFISDF